MQSRREALELIVDFLDNVGIGYCIIKANIGFGWIKTLSGDNVQKNRKMSIPISSSQEINWTCQDEVIQAIVNIIKDKNSHTNQTYTLTSKEQITMAEIANQLSEAISDKFEYEQCESSPEFFTEKAKWITPTLGEALHSIYSESLICPEERTDDLEKLLGKDPTTFKEWIKPNTHLFL